jgi:hypothetical protein
MFCLKLFLILCLANAVLSKATFQSISVFCAKESHRLGPMDLKIAIPQQIKPTTVTLQMTKSTDFRQNFLCDFHICWFSEEPACDAQQQPEAIRGGRKLTRPLLQLHPRGIEDGLEIEDFLFDKNLEKNFCKMLAIEIGKSLGEISYCKKTL